MTGTRHDGFAIPLSIACEHGLLHGRLARAENASGLVVLVHDSLTQDADSDVLAALFRRAGLSTLSIDLITEQENHFADVHNNVPLLVKRLLDFLGLIKNRMLLGELKAQPIGLWAADATAPAVVRVAGLRDHDIAAVVCRGGLIDLAGMLYLRALEAPLLVLVEETDAQRIASNTRALREVPCRKQLKLIPEIGADYPASAGFELVAREASDWFVDHFRAAASLEAKF